MIEILYALLGLVGGYALGSIPFGLVLTRMAGLGDIRTIGSGNIGATNVLRTGRKDLAFLTLIGDAGKGAAAVFLFSYLSPFASIGAALGSVMGHLFPIWLGFKGGKGVATTLGVLVMVTPIAGILTCATWIVMALLFRISSLAALVAVAIAPFFAGIIYGEIYGVLTTVIAGLIWYKHAENIQRLLSGIEPKIGDKSKSGNMK
jgi:acyl phosphate:glycerol-3-phosphate acyltransferase